MKFPDWTSLAGICVVVETPEESELEPEFAAEICRVGLKTDAKFYAVHTSFQHVVANTLAVNWTNRDEDEFFAAYRAVMYAKSVESGIMIIRPGMRFVADMDELSASVESIASDMSMVTVLDEVLDRDVHDTIERVPPDLRTGLCERMLSSNCIVIPKACVDPMIGWFDSVSADETFAVSFYQHVGRISRHCASGVSMSSPRFVDPQNFGMM